MNSETIRVISQIRQQFYSLFEQGMDIPVKITNRNSSSGNPPIASWIDSQQRLNYLCIFAHTAPDALVPERPLTLRLLVNKGGELTAVISQKKRGQELNRSRQLEMILLPEETLDFLPWIVNLVQSFDVDEVETIPTPPHPLDAEVAPAAPISSITTQQASRQLLQCR